MTRRPVFIEGVGIHPFGRFADKDVTTLGREAVLAAASDAGMQGGEFEAAFCATVYSGVAAGHKVLSSLGWSGPPIINLEAGCASGGAALSLGADLIAAGRYDRVLVFGMEKMPRGMVRSSFFPPWCEAAGLTPAPAYFALRARRLMQESGVTSEDLARVSVKNHEHGAQNPFAMYRKSVTIDEVLASRMVCDPLTLWMLCAPNEGAAAVVLSATAPSDKPRIRVRAAVLRSHRPGSALGEHTPMSGRTDGEPPSPTTIAATAAFAQAEIGVDDLDVVELQDTDAGREILSIEELGLCSRGEGGAFVREGHGEMSGRLPINPSGGLLSKGEPLGASALGQIVELTWQLRGEAGPRQVAEARLALGHTVGRGANASIVILGRD
jgi:acetyl-CoA acetyltransferase